MKKIIITTGIVGLPGIASAATIRNFEELIAFTGAAINAIIPLLFGIAILTFIWGIIKFMAKANDPKARTEGRNLMIFGIIGIAVMMSVWGLALLVKSIFFEGSPIPF